jgi:predicted transcriptional regulator
MASIKLNSKLEILEIVRSASEGTEKSNYVEKLVRKSGFSYTFFRRTVCELEREGLIKKVPCKRRNYLFLTDKGREISDSFRKLKDSIQNRR